MLLIGVFVLMELFGMVKDVHIQVVLLDKCMMVPNVSVLLGGILMGRYACNVLMDNNGYRTQNHVNVHQDITGLDNSVIKHTLAQVIGSGTKLTNSVYVQKENSGTEEVVLLSLFVMVDRSGVQKSRNVYVQEG
jgi:hypothetical protein